MKKLHISESLALPIDIATEKLGHLGTTGSGKTYGASKLAELMLDAGVQIVVLDYVGIWYGLRLAADGKSPGIPIPLFGGLRGDLPLEPSAGAMMADLIVDRGISAILDVSQFELDTDKARFGAAFANRLFFRKKSSPSALHIFIEEAQEFIPEDPQKGDVLMLHAFNRIQKIGRNFGIGTSLITQRPQEVNKKALNLAQTLFVYRSTGPHERKAIAAWMQAKGLPQDIANDLPTLPTGVAHVWSPQFLGISEKVKISAKRTFDSSATPKVGASTKKAKDLAPVDLAKIREDMAATIERAKESDPKELKKQLDLAKRELAQLQKRAPVEKTKTIEVPVLKNGQLDRVEKVLDRAERLAVQATTMVKELRSALTRRPSQGTPVAEVAVPGAVDGRAALTWTPPTSRPTRAAGAAAARRDGKQVGGSIKKILTALAQHPEGLTYRQIGTFAGVSVKGGSFASWMSACRQNGWILGGAGEAVRITDAGLDALGDYDALPTGRDLAAYWIREVGGTPARILDYLVQAYPSGRSYPQIGNDLGISIKGGSFASWMSALRTRDLITGSPTAIRASELFFS